jgi:hypothetical protein
MQLAVSIRLYKYEYAQVKLRKIGWNNKKKLLKNKEILLKINKYSERVCRNTAKDLLRGGNSVPQVPLLITIIKKKSLLLSHIHVKCVLWHLIVITLFNPKY